MIIIMQRYNYCNLIINYLVTNFINKIFKIILKQKNKRKINKMLFQKQHKTFLILLFYTNIVFMSTFILILFHVRVTKTRNPFTWCNQEGGQHGAGYGQAQLHERKHTALPKVEAENSAAIRLLKKKNMVTNKKKGEDV